VLWGTLWTGIGGLTGAFLAKAMVQTFGKGLLSSNVHPSVAAATATLAGAALWVAIATRKGLPVSTTHAIVGSVAGVASAAYGMGGVNWVAFGSKIILPLLLSPVLSLALTFAVLRLWKVFAPNSAADCLCLEVPQPTVAVLARGGSMVTGATAPMLEMTTCIAEKSSLVGVSLDHLHWLTSGATSFARGMNDAPKMVALVLGAAVLSGTTFNLPLAYFIAITTGMLAGSWIAGRRVTEVMSYKVTPMDHREGFMANLVTAALVGPGAALGLPMSTTHVASGAIMGVAAMRGGGANGKTIRAMFLAWVVTLPAAALLGVGTLIILRALGWH